MNEVINVVDWDEATREECVQLQQYKTHTMVAHMTVMLCTIRKVSPRDVNGFAVEG